MTAELYKMTEETTIQDGVETKDITQMETILRDENGNEIGRLHVNKWGASLNYNTGHLDVQAVSEGILGVLMSAEAK